APDLLVGLAFGWVLRRPEYVPVVLIALVFLAADLLFQRPPGLFAALVIWGSEFLRSRSHFMREFPFLLEWVIVATVIAGVMVANRLIQLAVVLEPPALGLTAIQFATTVLAYPLVVLFSWLALGVRHHGPGSADATRQRV
ncbi:MAG: rod shape-determining protein MreD, partial [Halocynthiibacter sp.]